MKTKEDRKRGYSSPIEVGTPLEPLLLHNLIFCMNLVMGNVTGMIKCVCPYPNNGIVVRGIFYCRFSDWCDYSKIGR